MIVIVDHMPMTNVGKIYKPELRALAARKVAEALVDEACARARPGDAAPRCRPMASSALQVVVDAAAAGAQAGAPAGAAAEALGRLPVKTRAPALAPRAEPSHDLRTGDHMNPTPSTRRACSAPRPRALALGPGTRPGPDLPEQADQDGGPLRRRRRHRRAGARDRREARRRPRPAVVIDNKPGAAGIIGTDAVAKAAPDGYTIVMSLSNALLTNQFLYEKLPYNPQRDLTLVYQVAMGPLVLVVHPSVPVKTGAELPKYVAANKGKLAYGSYGVGAYPHLAGAT